MRPLCLYWLGPIRVYGILFFFVADDDTEFAGSGVPGQQVAHDAFFDQPPVFGCAVVVCGDPPEVDYTFHLCVRW